MCTSTKKGAELLFSFWVAWGEGRHMLIHGKRTTTPILATGSCTVLEMTVNNHAEIPAPIGCRSLTSRNPLGTHAVSTREISIFVLGLLEL